MIAAWTLFAAAEGPGTYFVPPKGTVEMPFRTAEAFRVRDPFVLADESTSDLDAGNRELMIAALREEAARGAAVVLATHDPEAAARADAVLALDEGAAAWVREG